MIEAPGPGLPVQSRPQLMTSTKRTATELLPGRQPCIPVSPGEGKLVTCSLTERKSSSDFHGLHSEPEPLTVLRHAGLDPLACNGPPGPRNRLVPQRPTAAIGLYFLESEPFSSRVCPADLQDVDGPGELPGGLAGSESSPSNLIGANGFAGRDHCSRVCGAQRRRAAGAPLTVILNGKRIGGTVGRATRTERLGAAPETA
jgi:hypothetical protein